MGDTGSRSHLRIVLGEGGRLLLQARLDTLVVVHATDFHTGKVIFVPCSLKLVLMLSLGWWYIHPHPVPSRNCCLEDDRIDKHYCWSLWGVPEHRICAARACETISLVKLSARPAPQRQTHLPSTRVSQQKLGFVPGEVPSKVCSPPPPPLAWSGQGNKAVSRLASWGRRSLAAVYSAREVAYSWAQEIYIGELAICPCRLSVPGDPPWRGLTVCPCRRAAHCWCTWPGGWYSRPSPSFS